MINNPICTQDDLDRGIVCLTCGQRIGLTLDVEAALISLAAILGAFVLIFIKVWSTRRVVQRPMDLFILALFSFDIYMALGRITHIKWIQGGKIFQGSYCTTQGILQQLGETGSAMVTTVIAIYTFVIVMWGRPCNYELLIAYLSIGAVWVFLIIFVGITVGTQTHGTQDYMTPVGFWCWIGDGSRYDAERFAGEFGWMWAALAISAITYIPLAIKDRIRVNRDPLCRFGFDIQLQHDEGQGRRSISMIAYPVVYFVLVIPVSAVRWVSGFGSGQRALPSAATFITECLYSLSGLANVLIFLFTRSDLFMVGNAEGRGFRLYRTGAAALP